jgi:hypothetical protein
MLASGWLAVMAALENETSRPLSRNEPPRLSDRHGHSPASPCILSSAGGFVDRDENRPDLLRVDTRKCGTSNSEPALPRLEQLAMPYRRWMPQPRLARASEGDKSMFSVGQKVWHRDGQRRGTVLECDEDRVFIAQDNGAELDFWASDLTVTPPPGAKTSGAKLQDGREATRSAAYMMPSRTLTSGDITAEHVRVLGIVPVRTLQAVAAVFERRPRAGKFSALQVAEKLNVIAEITAVPYRMMREHSDHPGELGLLMSKGLADSRKIV